MYSTRLISTALLALALLQACAPSVRPPRGPALDPALLAQVDTLRAAGDYEAAAAALQRAAATADSPAREELMLLAAQALGDGGQTAPALELLERVAEPGLPPALALRKHLVGGRILLIAGEPAAALQALGPPPQAADTPHELQQDYYRLQSEGLRKTGQSLESARALTVLDGLLADPQARQDNQVEILLALTMLPNDYLEREQRLQPQPLAGWIQLVLLLKEPGLSPKLAAPLVEGWRSGVPDHPALPGIAGAYLGRLEEERFQPARIAVLLPLSGPYQKVAAALRDGMIAAYFEQPAEQRPLLRFYDSSDSVDTWPLYTRAAAEGAELVVGPLDKQAVAQLALAGELRVPVLALNQVVPENPLPENLYQFALSPEDEARQVAERAAAEGMTQALVFAPQGQWGERLSSSFRARWEELAGRVVGEAAYDEGTSDFSDPLRTLLQIDASQQRRREVEGVLGRSVEFEPRRRRDAQFVFLAARAGKAYEIRPQLQFHHAQDLPVLATSHILPADLGPTRHVDLEGVRFPDIPWLYAQGPGLAPPSLLAALPQADPRYFRYYAMGMDSYALVPALRWLRRNPGIALNGKTGGLSLDEQRRVRRQLVWLEIRDGVPQLLDGSPAGTGLPAAEPIPEGEAPPPDESGETTGDGSTPGR